MDLHLRAEVAAQGPLTFAFARLLWKGYMGRAMREAKAQAEAASRRAG